MTKDMIRKDFLHERFASVKDKQVQITFDTVSECSGNERTEDGSKLYHGKFRLQGDRGKSMPPHRHCEEDQNASRRSASSRAGGGCNTGRSHSRPPHSGGGRDGLWSSHSLHSDSDGNARKQDRNPMLLGSTAGRGRTGRPESGKQDLNKSDPSKQSFDDNSDGEAPPQVRIRSSSRPQRSGDQEGVRPSSEAARRSREDAQPTGHRNSKGDLFPEFVPKRVSVHDEFVPKRVSVHDDPPLPPPPRAPSISEEGVRRTSNPGVDEGKRTSNTGLQEGKRASNTSNTGYQEGKRASNTFNTGYQEEGKRASNTSNTGYQEEGKRASNTSNTGYQEEGKRASNTSNTGYQEEGKRASNTSNTGYQEEGKRASNTSKTGYQEEGKRASNTSNTGFQEGKRASNTSNTGFQEGRSDGGHSDSEGTVIPGSKQRSSSMQPMEIGQQQQENSGGWLQKKLFAKRPWQSKKPVHQGSPEQEASDGDQSGLPGRSGKVKIPTMEDDPNASDDAGADSIQEPTKLQNSQPRPTTYHRSTAKENLDDPNFDEIQSVEPEGSEQWCTLEKEEDKKDEVKDEADKMVRQLSVVPEDDDETERRPSRLGSLAGRQGPSRRGSQDEERAPSHRGSQADQSSGETSQQKPPIFITLRPQGSVCIWSQHWEPLVDVRLFSPQGPPRGVTTLQWKLGVEKQIQVSEADTEIHFEILKPTSQEPMTPTGDAHGTVYIVDLLKDGNAYFSRVPLLEEVAGRGAILDLSMVYKSGPRLSLHKRVSFLKDVSPSRSLSPGEEPGRKQRTATPFPRSSVEGSRSEKNSSEAGSDDTLADDTLAASRLPEGRLSSVASLGGDGRRSRAGSQAQEPRTSTLSVTRSVAFDEGKGVGDIAGRRPSQDPQERRTSQDSPPMVVRQSDQLERRASQDSPPMAKRPSEQQERRTSQDSPPMAKRPSVSGECRFRRAMCRFTVPDTATFCGVGMALQLTDTCDAEPLKGLEHSALMLLLEQTESSVKAVRSSRPGAGVATTASGMPVLVANLSQKLVEYCRDLADCNIVKTLYGIPVVLAILVQLVEAMDTLVPPEEDIVESMSGKTAALSRMAGGGEACPPYTGMVMEALSQALGPQGFLPQCVQLLGDGAAAKDLQKMGCAMLAKEMGLHAMFAIRLALAWEPPRSVPKPDEMMLNFNGYQAVFGSMVDLLSKLQRFASPPVSGDRRHSEVGKKAPNARALAQLALCFEVMRFGLRSDSGIDSICGFGGERSPAVSPNGKRGSREGNRASGTVSPLAPMLVEALENLVAVPKDLGTPEAVEAALPAAIRLLGVLLDIPVLAASISTERLARALKRILTSKPLTLRLAAATRELVASARPERPRRWFSGQAANFRKDLCRSMARESVPSEMVQAALKMLGEEPLRPAPRPSWIQSSDPSQSPTSLGQEVREAAERTYVVGAYYDCVEDVVVAVFGPTAAVDEMAQLRTARAEADAGELAGQDGGDSDTSATLRRRPSMMKALGNMRQSILDSCVSPSKKRAAGMRI